MGLFDKFKNLFTDEVEEEVPIKKEVIKVEIAPPRREEVKKEIEISESEALKREEKQAFPVFSDRDFDDLVKPKEEKPKVIYGSSKPQKKEERKPFKVSPIISPVYGILDKNYTKEDITTKQTAKQDYQYTNKELTIEDIRKKAYGTLEEDLKTELFSHNSVLFNDKAEEPEELDDLFLELQDDKVDLVIPEKDTKEDWNELEVDIKIEADTIQINHYHAPAEEKETRSKRNESVAQDFEEDTLTESDLFDLIDSMYQKEESEEEKEWKS